MAPNENFISPNSKIVISLFEYLSFSFSEKEINSILSEINAFSIEPLKFQTVSKSKTYKELDGILSCENERQEKRKDNGVYYTERDIVEAIITEAVFHIGERFFVDGAVFDPTCGSGEFLLFALEYKVAINEKKNLNIPAKKMLSTICGNDINIESVFIAKLRLFLFILNKFGAKEIKGIGKILNENFACEDFLEYSKSRKFDFITGNPPYVENKKISKYGNIYADVLDKATDLISETGVMGFIIPLSYVATPRMKNIRKKIEDNFHTQILYNYSDRPACLFTSVHQKLTILIALKSDEKMFFTGNYQYWYKEERKKLFFKQSFIPNPFVQEDFIPKIGTAEDLSIYGKIINREQSIKGFLANDKSEAAKKINCVYLNMRASFWIKAFLNEHMGKEYKALLCKNENDKCYLFCILNSSLFWWFWVCVSDCWHITNKEFANFKFSTDYDKKAVKKLATELDAKLEDTKEYVGTRQVDFEYKHKNCLKEINAVDDYINNLLGLNEKENDYIKNFALTYRTSGGLQN